MDYPSFEIWAHNRARPTSKTPRVPRILQTGNSRTGLPVSLCCTAGYGCDEPARVAAASLQETAFLFQPLHKFCASDVENTTARSSEMESSYRPFLSFLLNPKTSYVL